ncbi:MAG: alpha/beta hydrolase, partial [Verrucomicrobiales bacterium]
YRAAEAAYHYLRDELGTDPDKIFLCGQSVGSGPTCHLAARVPHRAVVLLAPFHTAYQVATRIPLFPGDRFPNGDNLAQVDTPLIIIHGIDDRIIPISQGIKLYHRSPSKKKYFLPIEDSGHNELYVVGSWRVFTAIRFILNESSEAPESAFP